MEKLSPCDSLQTGFGITGILAGIRNTIKKDNQRKTKESFIEHWDEIWNSYDRKRYEYQLALEEHRVRWQRIQNYILEKFGSFTDLKCLEVGAGSGHYSMLFARKGAHVTLLDYSEKALAFCKNVFKDQCIPEDQVHFVHMNALDLKPELVGKFALSMSFGVAEHFEGNERKIIIKNHLKVLKYDGVAFISVPNAACIPFQIYQFLMGQRKKGIIEYLPYSKRELKHIAEECNIKKYDFVGSSYWETYSLLSFYRRKRGLIRDISEIKREKISWLDKYLGREITFICAKGKV